MTPDERALVMALGAIPGRPPPMPLGEFLRKFGATDGFALGLDLLRDTVDHRDAVDVELALTVASRFGFADAHLLLLHELTFADWHHRHEDVARALSDIRSPTSLDALMHLATWVPSYLDWDDNRALATKAIWGLGFVNTDRALNALTELAGSDNAIIADGAIEQLQR